MSNKCKCGGFFDYVTQDTIISKKQSRKIRMDHFSGIYLKCDKCQSLPEAKVFIKLSLDMVSKIHTKSDFAKLIGIKPQSVDTMSKNNRLKIVMFAKKEFIYYDK